MFGYMNYDPSWKNNIPEKKYRIYERIGPRWAEIISSYPDFVSIEEAFTYIHNVLDPYYTSHYSVSVDRK